MSLPTPLSGDRSDLRASDQNVLDALVGAADLVLMRDGRGRVSYVNQAFLTAFGGEEEDWLGRWFAMAPPREDEGPRSYDMLMRTRTGPLWIEWSETRLRGDRGVLSIGRDVTHRRRAADDMEASQRAKALFFAGVTHELRTPLAGALGMARLLENTDLNADQADYLRAVGQSTRHALKLIDDILDLSRLEAGKLDLRPEPCDVAELVRDTIELAAPRAHEKGLDILAVHHTGAPTRILGDAARIKQILFNLIGNAVKFTDEGGIRIDIAVTPQSSEEAPHGLLTLSVTDTGPGISETDQEHLFEAFERGSAEREGREGGAGLGLSMVRRLADAMESELGLESRPGEGARFWMTFNLPVEAYAHETPLEGYAVAVAGPDAFVRRGLIDQVRALGGEVTEISEIAHLRAAAGQNLILDQAWRDEAERTGARHCWVLVRPDEKPAVLEEKNRGVDGWLVKPVRRATLIEQITNRIPQSFHRTEAEPMQTPKPDTNPLAGLRVLVAEDDPVNALIARKTLQRFGIDVVPAESGPAALQALESTDLDAALLDQRMPGMDGPSVAEYARAAGVDIPLIALTANASEADRTRCLGAGMDEFLTKPLDPEVLRETLVRLCADQKQASMRA